MRAITISFSALIATIGVSADAYAAPATMISCPGRLLPNYHPDPGTKQRGFVPSDGATLSKASLVELRPDDQNPLEDGQNPDNERQAKGLATILYSSETSAAEPRSIACYYGDPDPAYPVILLIPLPDDRQIECRHRYATDPRRRKTIPTTMHCAVRLIPDPTRP